MAFQIDGLFGATDIGCPISGHNKKMGCSSLFAANEKICTRCGKLFQVTAKGKYLTREACSYHWGKCWKKKGVATFKSEFLASSIGLTNVHCFDEKQAYPCCVVTL